ncbi:MAG TPA: glycosyltransferase family 4 protein [Steroidobacteraceae bacterium]|nr:glycosyltransferase family 4 protein [Steroidobacteraceae bacterium]
MPVTVLPHHCIGGMQAVAWDLARAFVRTGVGVTVLTAEIPGRPAAIEDEGVAIRALPGTSWRHYGSGWWRATRRVFKQELIGRCDLLFSVSAGGFGLLPLRERIPHVPFVMQAHGTSMGEVVSKWRSRSVRAMATSARNVAWILKDLAAYPQFDAIVAVGDRVAHDLAAWPASYAVDEKRVHVIRNGIDTGTFRPDNAARRRVRAELGWDEDFKVVISASRLHRQKGVAYGLEAFALLAKNRQDLRYLIVGEGPELQALRERAASLGIGDQVRFAGGVSRDRMPAYLNAADVMMFTTTRVEGEPLNVLEALAVGLPAVVSEHLYTGSPPSDQILLARPNDRTAVAAALQRALAIPVRREGKLPVGYSAAASIEQYLSLFESLRQRRA